MGHVKPMLALLQALVGDGERLVCYGHRDFEDVIGATGAEFRPYPAVDYDIHAPDFNLVRMAADLVDASETIVPALMPEIERLAPRLIVQDFMALWGSRIATALAIPRIHTVPTIVFNATAQRKMRREDGVAKLARDVARGLPALVRAKLRSRFAVSVEEAFAVDGRWRSLAPPLAEIVFSLERLQVGQKHGTVPRHYIGASFPRPPTVASASTGHALVTFGTLSNTDTARFEAAIEGAFDAGYSVIGQCGDKVDTARLERLAGSLEGRSPERTVLIVQTVPDLEALIAGAAVVIHHAGMATTWETLRHGKPALFIPTIADQKVLATQLEANGAGLRLPAGRECDARAIATALERLRTAKLDLAGMKASMDAAGGAPVGHTVIRDVLARLP